MATPAALEAIAESDQPPLDFIARYVKGDWGEVGSEDWQSNDDALEEGLRLLSSYRTLKDVKIWIITEADRSITTILLSDEY